MRSLPPTVTLCLSAAQYRSTRPATHRSTRLWQKAQQQTCGTQRHARGTNTDRAPRARRALVSSQSIRVQPEVCSL